MEPEESSDPKKQQFPWLSQLEDYYSSSLSARQSMAADNTSKFHQLLGQYAPPAASSFSSSQSAGTSNYQDMLDAAAVSMTNYDAQGFYPEQKLYDILGTYLTPTIEDIMWHNNLKAALSSLNGKLSSPRLRMEILWHSGFEDRELKKLQQSLLAIQIVVDDIKREEKDLNLWKALHRNLKDLLCEVGDMLDDFALRAPHLKQLLQSHQASHHPYFTDKLVQMNNLIHELDAIAEEIKSVVLPEFNTRRRKPPGPQFHTTGGKKSDPIASPVVDEMPIFYALIRQQGISRDSDKDEPAAKSVPRKKSDFISESKEEDHFISVSMEEKDFISPSNKADVRMKKSDTESTLEIRFGSDSASKMTTSIESLPMHLKKCLLYTSLFPRNYELEKDTLVQMWIAVGYIRIEANKLMEETAGNYFDELLSMSLFQVSTLNKSRYILDDEVYKLVQEESSGEYVRLEDGNLNGISRQTLHSSVLYESTVDPMIFKSFHKLKGLHSLLLLHETRKYIKQIPYDLILSLRCVRVLDLSGTQIKELPSSVGDMKTLHYLDLSGTPIKILPQSISNLSSLQILKMRDCLNFVELPKTMKKIFNLRHLELDIARQLTFMPPRIGRLTNLQTLSAFIAGKGRGFQISELKDMVNLRGSLCIIKLENVLTVEDAEEAALYDKQYLHRVELQWSLACLEAVEVLEGLEPHRNIRELKIICYGGRTFPTWLGDSSFSKLTNIYIYNCKNCILLPLLGRLPSLKSLCIREMHAIKKVDEQFFGGSRAKGFSKLETLEFDGMPSLEEWTGLQENGMPSLRKLTIVDCPNLVQLPELSNLKFLQHLEIRLCFKLPSLAEERLPTSVRTLIITDCPKLKEGYQEEGADWHKIEDIHSIWIDYQKISHQKPYSNEPA